MKIHFNVSLKGYERKDRDERDAIKADLKEKGISLREDFKTKAAAMPLFKKVNKLYPDKFYICEASYLSMFSI